jgi:hypothetical protein
MYCSFFAAYDKIVWEECLKRSECSDFWISCNVYPLRALIKGIHAQGGYYLTILSTQTSDTKSILWEIYEMN